MTQGAHNWAVETLIRAFGPMRGAYTGPYPDPAQARAAAESGEPISAAEFRADRVYVGTRVINLVHGQGEALYLCPARANAMISVDGSLDRAAGPIRAVIWQEQCLILRVPLEPKLNSWVQPAILALIDATTGEAFAFYLEGDIEPGRPVRLRR
jgi:hypothetical protein